MSKSIGILTYHNADNFGAVLQAYALQTVLMKKFNVDAQIINYHCDAVERTRYVYKNGKGLKALIRKCLLSIYYANKRSNFNKFRLKNLRLSPVYDSRNIKQCAYKYDAFIVGSDQVWNLECSGWDYTFFLKFVVSKKKFSYAASIGTYIYTNSEQQKIADYLIAFDGVSVREQSGAIRLQEIGIKDIWVHPDPVFLLTSNYWKKIMSKRLCSCNYLFIYLVQQDVNVRREAKQYAKMHNLKIIDNKKNIYFMYRNSPADFLSWIFYADCVFTNSFHGTAFSLVFNKPLAADIELANGKINNRIRDVLETLHAEKCILKENLQQVYRPNAATIVEQLCVKAFEYLSRICN